MYILYFKFKKRNSCKTSINDYIHKSLIDVLSVSGVKINKVVIL